ncbi:uncharacterized protein DUF547 [Aquimarina sp. MAR_2010_214]|uniref:DUF547 domain-containing protein n=1 Tax=Aquimarina sp. MAR_2010_214 TaxID=1250026 RepID=UPI000C70121A|nr:DUF547 domain-containing protein [Aquimarina sp. MAR_2010_214]PKV48154.1 uncharacterized protein DUF547 [Aquimarina sp. MAR_2010_214]
MKAPKIILVLFAILSINQMQSQNSFDHIIWDQALLLNVSDDGKVDYNGFMRDSSQLYRYFKQLSENPPQENWTREEKLAYWINAYNAYTIKLVIDSYPLKSIKDLDDPWGKKFFKIDGVWHSLGELEHKILRKFGDPRIHFAINCASISCPVVWNRAYTADNLNTALDHQTEKFINDPTRNTITKDKVIVSKIFTWYKKDFKVNGGNVKDFINRYASIKIDKQSKKGYKEYNWKLNEHSNEYPAAVVLD